MGQKLTGFMSAATAWLGSLPVVIGSFVIIIVWALTGPLLGFSNTWQLIINTATTVITFNMVFVIQNTQNRDGRALHTKLDAILDHLDIDSADLKGLEDLPEVDIRDRQERVRA